MKYIRTTNNLITDTQPKEKNVFDTNKYFILNENELVERYAEEYGENGCWCCEYKYRKIGVVCNQADTIEELCDEFVCCIGKNTHWLSPFKDFYNTREQWNFETLYGAIWTDKGLIYVAKMNDKGELELL